MSPRGMPNKPRRDFNLGGEQAEADKLLQHAFYESAHYFTIADRDDTRCFIVGRTGSGKSAILQRIEEENPEHVIRINPEDLSLPYITDLNVVRYLQDLGVHLDPFFTALWKHVLIIEIIRHRYKVNSPQEKQNFMTGLREKLHRDKSKEAALDYLNDFEDKFWCETDERVRDITTKFTDSVKAEAGGKIGKNSASLGASAASNSTYSEEERTLQASRFQRIVNESQLPRLNKMISVLDENILDSPQYYRYVLIDDLDREWVDERILNSLIRCLFKAVVDLRRVGNMKVLVALRTNIFEHLDFGRSGGQEEKYRFLTYKLKWTRADLERLIDVRVKTAAERREITGLDSAKSVLPAPNKARGNAMDYIFRRTLMRPRDVIAFFNECYTNSAGKARLTWEVIHDSEQEYSINRLQALRDEWKPSYPGIDRVFDVFRGSLHFLSHKDLANLLDAVALLLADYKSAAGLAWLTKVAEPIWDNYGDEDWSNNYAPLVNLLYSIDFLGCSKTGKKGSVIYAHNEPNLIERPSQLREMRGFSVHPAFWLALDINPDRS